jgi:hypothetical protein
MRKSTAIIMTNLFYLFLFIFITSCASIFRSPKGNKVETKIHISTNPPNADVYLNNSKIGETPFDYIHKGRKQKTIQIKEEGYFNEQRDIKRKLNLLWTSISVVTGLFPGLGIPIIIDNSTGSIYDIKSDSIHINLVSLKGPNPKENITQFNPSNSKPFTPINEIKKEAITVGNSILNTSSNNQNRTEFESDNQFLMPALEIITGGRKMIIRRKTRVNISLKTGGSFGTLITAVHNDRLEVRGQQDVYFSNIRRIRVYPRRLWFPILTAPTVVQPILWYASSKVAELNSTRCRRNVISMRTVEGLFEYHYGSRFCNY